MNRRGSRLNSISHGALKRDVFHAVVIGVRLFCFDFGNSECTSSIAPLKRHWRLAEETSRQIFYDNASMEPRSSREEKRDWLGLLIRGYLEQLPTDWCGRSQSKAFIIHWKNLVHMTGIRVLQGFCRTAFLYRIYYHIGNIAQNPRLVWGYCCS